MSLNVAAHTLNTPLFEALSAADVWAVEEAATLCNYHRREMIFFTGDKASHIYLLQSGLVQVVYGNPRGDEAIVNIFQAGDIFGDLFLGKYRHRIGIAMTLTPVTLATLHEDDLESLSLRIPRLALNYVRYQANVQREMFARMHALMHMNARDRLLGVLLHLANRYCCTRDGWFKVPSAITQSDLANLTVLNRTTVNILINELRDEGILGGSGRRLLVNRNAVMERLAADGIEMLR